MSPKFGDGNSLKSYAPELLTVVIFNVYDQHTQIITELVVKLNKWHITLDHYGQKQQQFRLNEMDDRLTDFVEGDG